MKIVRTMGLLGALMTLSLAARPAPAAADLWSFVACQAACVVGGTVCAATNPELADKCAIFAQGCVTGCGLE